MMRKISEFFVSILLLFISLSNSSVYSLNLIVNGDFSSGNTGFTSDYSFYTAGTVPSVGAQKAYGIVTNPKAWFSAFSTCQDHTTGFGNIMVVDGSTSNIGNNKLWEQTIPVSAGKNYDFSYYLQSVTTGTPAKIEIQINGVSLGPPFTAPSTTCSWIQKVYTWNAGVSSSAIITIYDREISGNGNDFAIDDLSFLLAPTPPTVTTPIYLCQNSISLPLTAIPSGGGTLKWYGALTGGVALSGAPTPSTTTAGSTTYYVTETILGVESTPRTPLVVNVVSDNGQTIPSFSCDTSQISVYSSQYTPPLTVNNCVFFEWGPNPLLANPEFLVKYTLPDGTIKTDATVPTHYIVPNLLPGQSITLELSSKKFPCVPIQTKTCTVPCPLPLTTPNFPLITQKYCVGNTMPTLSNTSPNNISGTWSPAVISNAASGSYIFTPDPVLFPCALTQTLNVTVNPIAAPTFSALPISVCENATAPVLPLISTNTIPITGAWDQSINTSILGPKTYTFVPDGGQCVPSLPTSVVITVNSSAAPTFNPIPAFCAGTPAVPSLPATSTNIPPISGVWNPATIDNTTTRDYEFTPNIGLHPCAPKTKLTVTVTQNVTPTFAVSDTQCENTGILILPTNSTNTPPISGSWDINTVDTSIIGVYPRVFTPSLGSCVISPTTPKTITVYSTAMPTFDAIPDFCSGTPSPSFPVSNEIPPITGTWLPNTISNTTGTKNYQFTPDTALFPCAPIPPPLSVTVLPSATPTFLPSVPTDVCEGASLPDLPTESNDSPPITGVWSTVTGTISTIDTSIVGTEAYTFTPDAGQCAIAIPPINITVKPIDTLTGVSWTVTDAFTENQIITVIATASGNYLYQLDYGPFQSSPIFENVASGIHSITVMDAGGCSAPITEDNILIIKHPKFFTPNGDNYNDAWNIFDLKDQLNSRIYIFDRYGKLLKEISPNGLGWDGTYIGQPMPADDYWFNVEYIENAVLKKFKSHFSLKR